MKLKRIEIYNFRGIKKTHIEGFEQINFLLGNNNSGKTSVLEAIFLSVGINNPMLPIHINRFRNLRQTDEEDFRLLFYNLDYKNQPKLISCFNENDHTRILELIPRLRKKSNGALKKNQISDSINDSIYETRIDSSIVDGLTLEFSIKEKHKPLKKYTSEVFIEQSSITSKASEDFKEELNAVYIFPAAHYPNLDTRLEKLIVNKSHQSIVSILKIIDNSIQDISLGTNGMIYFDIGLERLIPVNLSGDGIKRILSILVTIADSKNGIVIIDEIDNGLHFSSQATLLRALLKASKEYNVQIFATTHNYETLKKLKEVLDEEVMMEYRDQVKSFTLRKTTGNELISYPYNYEKFDYAIKQEIEIR